MKTIIWDVDDVLNNLIQDWFEQHWLISHPYCKVKYEDLLENPPHELLGTTLNDYRSSLDEFRSQSGQLFKPVPEVYDWFVVNGHKYRHIALSMVPLKLAHISAAWVFQNFGKWIRSFNIVPSPRETDPAFKYDLSKKDFLMWLTAGDFFIDDSLVNIRDAKGLGLKTIIFPRPWNRIVASRGEVLGQLK